MSAGVMSEQNINTIRNYFKALESGDMETFAAMFADNVVWHQPGNNKYSGDKQGVAEIGQMVAAMMQETQGSFALKTQGDPSANGQLVAVPVSFGGEKAQQTMQMRGTDLFRMNDGKIVEVWLFSEDQRAEDQFWGI
ncbi:nuclear transport factor 2 family protein [Shewanella corallii]|uniref:Nuclear transport factor 2 family protein n=1 Tax=Shewanella corallii TaxID=560080 RepID=A0ABT0N807_9GAMM|nr:nuclear transport factor 2 family protein [Shewanella corallii]MCL2914592.1 nuclear transport factor 2 family protein [Shewanella corallii]